MGETLSVQHGGALRKLEEGLPRLREDIFGEGSEKLQGRYGRGL